MESLILESDQEQQLITMSAALIALAHKYGGEIFISEADIVAASGMNLLIAFHKGKDITVKAYKHGEQPDQ